MPMANRLTDEPALGATDIEHVFHAVLAQHLGDRVPSLVGVADIGKTPAPDFDLLIRPAARIGHVERGFDQAKHEAPAQIAQDLSHPTPQRSPPPSLGIGGESLDDCRCHSLVSPSYTTQQAEARMAGRDGSGVTKTRWTSSCSLRTPSRKLSHSESHRFSPFLEA